MVLKKFAHEFIFSFSEKRKRPIDSPKSLINLSLPYPSSGMEHGPPLTRITPSIKTKSDIEKVISSKKTDLSEPVLVGNRLFRACFVLPIGKFSLVDIILNTLGINIQSEDFVERLNRSVANISGRNRTYLLKDFAPEKQQWPNFPLLNGKFFTFGDQEGEEPVSYFELLHEEEGLKGKILVPAKGVRLHSKQVSNFIEACDNAYRHSFDEFSQYVNQALLSPFLIGKDMKVLTKKKTDMTFFTFSEGIQRGCSSIITIDVKGESHTGFILGSDGKPMAYLTPERDSLRIETFLNKLLDIDAPQVPLFNEDELKMQAPYVQEYV